MRIDDFKNALQGGGARGNLFRCRTTFPTAVGVGGFEGAGRAVLLKVGLGGSVCIMAPWPHRP